MNLLWVDLEMTGLDVKKEVIIEVACIITDLDFNEIDSYHAVVKQDKKYLNRMDDWNKKHHTTSGLMKLVPQGLSPKTVENDLIKLVEKHFKDEKPVLAGNSISQDRLFIRKYFKKLETKLHYRMLDVTSWKVIMKNKLHIEYKKKNTHRAVDDIRESIQELKHYVSFIKKGDL